MSDSERDKDNEQAEGTNTPKTRNLSSGKRPSVKNRSLPANLPGFRAQLIFWLTVFSGLTADLWTKAAVFEWLKEQRSISVIDGILQLVTAVNTGAAFGIAAGHRYLLIGVSVAALLVIFAIFLFSRVRQKLFYVAIGLFTAGICGNLYDRIFNNGLVRDFIDVVYWKGKHWPAFNLADSMLCISVGLLIVMNLRRQK